MYQNTVPYLKDIQDFSFNRRLTTHEQHLIRPRVKCEAKVKGLRAVHLSSFHNSKDHCPQKLVKNTNDVSNKYSLSMIMLLSSLSNKGAHHSAFSEVCENFSHHSKEKEKTHSQNASEYENREKVENSSTKNGALIAKP